MFKEYTLKNYNFIDFWPLKMPDCSDIDFLKFVYWLIEDMINTFFENNIYIFFHFLILTYTSYLQTKI